LGIRRKTAVESFFIFLRSGSITDMRIKEKNENPEKGFSLIESLLSLSLFLVIVLSSLEVFGWTRTIFFKVKNKEEAKEAAQAALDKMRTDILAGGSGLIHPIHLGILEGISESEGTLTILSKEEVLTSAGDLVTGQTRIELDSTSSLKKGRDICIFDSLKGEIKSISSVEKGSIILSSALESSYSRDRTSLFLLQKVSLFLDEKTDVLRRKVNSSPAQPLAEDTAFFSFDYDRASSLVRLRLSLEPNKEKYYETTVFAKNVALATAR
jgi:type II secretory pathway pseudopilin PulG